MAFTQNLQSSRMTDLVNILEQALTSELGIEVYTNDFNNLRQRLYVVRKQFDRFACLTFSPHPSDPNKLWIKNKNVKP
jgi:hypothetical protein